MDKIYTLHTNQIWHPSCEIPYKDPDADAMWLGNDSIRNEVFSAKSRHGRGMRRGIQAALCQRISKLFVTTCSPHDLQGWWFLKCFSGFEIHRIGNQHFNPFSTNMFLVFS